MRKRLISTQRITAEMINEGTDLISIEDTDFLLPRVGVFFEDENFEEIKKSISEIGQIEPILVFEEEGKYVILSGLKRVWALYKLGFEKVKCIKVEIDFISAVKTYFEINKKRLTHIEICLLSQKLPPYERKFFGKFAIDFNFPQKLLYILHKKNIDLKHIEIIKIFESDRDFLEKFTEIAENLTASEIRKLIEYSAFIFRDKKKKEKFFSLKTFEDVKKIMFPEIMKRREEFERNIKGLRISVSTDEFFERNEIFVSFRVRSKDDLLSAQKDLENLTQKIDKLLEIVRG